MKRVHTTVTKKKQSLEMETFYVGNTLTDHIICYEKYYYAV